MPVTGPVVPGRWHPPGPYFRVGALCRRRTLEDAGGQWQLPAVLVLCCLLYSIAVCLSSEGLSEAQQRIPGSAASALRPRVAEHRDPKVESVASRVLALLCGSRKVVDVGDSTRQCCESYPSRWVNLPLKVSLGRRRIDNHERMDRVIVGTFCMLQPSAGQ